MPVELRKRKAHQQPAAPAPKRTSKTKAVAAKAKAKEAAAETTKKANKSTEEPKVEEETTAEAKPEAEAEPEKVEEKKEEEKEEPVKKEPKKNSGKVAVGDTIDLDGFGGDIVTNDGKETSLKKLVDESKAGVVLFTYPKASTPGCKFFLITLPHLLEWLY